METLPTLPPSSTEIAKLSTGDLAALVTITFMRKNREVSPNCVGFTANELQKTLSEKYKIYRLTIADLDKAFLNGVKGYYGEVYEIGYVTFCSWIDAYLSSDEYLEKIHNSMTIALPQKATITEQEIENEVKLFVVEKFDKYKETKILTDAGCICYKYLVRKKLLLLDNSKKWDAYNSAKEQIGKINAQKNKSRNALKDWVSKYNKDTDIIHTAKLLLVKEFFDKIIQFNKEESFKNALSV